jgi:hypothetical protein
MIALAGRRYQESAGSIQHAAAEGLFQVAFLARRQGMVKQDHLSLMQLNQLLDFFQFSGANEIARVNLFQSSTDNFHRAGASGERKLFEFAGVRDIGIVIQVQLHQDSNFATFGTFEKNSKTSSEPDSVLLASTSDQTKLI